jgi:hypothetical protein
VKDALVESITYITLEKKYACRKRESTFGNAYLVNASASQAAVRLPFRP